MPQARSTDHVLEVAAAFHAAWQRNAPRHGQPVSGAGFPDMPAAYQRCLLDTVQDLIVARVISPDWWA